ncbi:hypothetical protein N7490_009815 [Penicillium lividum]|nr:hypothetical protein N7490_009815 [Penicillium lividum]
MAFFGEPFRKIVPISGLRAEEDDAALALCLHFLNQEFPILPKQIPPSTPFFVLCFQKLRFQKANDVTATKTTQAKEITSTSICNKVSGTK